MAADVRSSRPEKLRKARDHIAARLTVREAATRLKVGKTALYKALEGVATAPIFCIVLTSAPLSDATERPPEISATLITAITGNSDPSAEP